MAISAVSMDNGHVNVNRINVQMKRQRIDFYNNIRTCNMLPTKDSLQGERHRPKNEEMENVFHANRNDNKSRVTVPHQIKQTTKQAVKTKKGII